LYKTLLIFFLELASFFCSASGEWQLCLEQRLCATKQGFEFPGLCFRWSPEEGDTLFRPRDARGGSHCGQPSLRPKQERGGKILSKQLSLRSEVCVCDAGVGEEVP